MAQVFRHLTSRLAALGVIRRAQYNTEIQYNTNTLTIGTLPMTYRFNERAICARKSPIKFGARNGTAARNLREDAEDYAANRCERIDVVARTPRQVAAYRLSRDTAIVTLICIFAEVRVYTHTHAEKARREHDLRPTSVRSKLNDRPCSGATSRAIPPSLLPLSLPLPPPPPRDRRAGTSGYSKYECSVLSVV